MQARTIQIFLPDGNPRGVRIAEITSRTIQVVQVPRASLDVALSRQELANVGVYFLVGDQDDAAAPKVYVGEAEDCGARLRQHNKQKDFWTTAIVAISRTQYFTKTHVKYLEWYSHHVIGKSARYSLENAAEPTKPHISESMQADLADNFDTIGTLTSTLGFPFFEQTHRPQKDTLLTCRGKDAIATGAYTDDGLIVFANATANLVESPSAGPWVIGIRDALKQAGVLVTEANVLRFKKDHLFSSPSAAAAAVLARRANGWAEWKYPDGRTLDEVIRQPSADSK